MSTKPGPRAPWIGMVGLLAALMAGGSANAQYVPGTPGQSPQRQERLDERTPAARQAEDYEPRGVRLGGFLLYPSIELDEGYNDNVFAVGPGSGPVGAFVQLVRPALELRSTWSNHMLNMWARGDIGFYTGTASAQNYQDVSVGAEGRLDIQRNWNVYGGLAYNRLHEIPGQPNTITGPTNTVVYNQLTGSVGYYQKINRFSGRADFSANYYTYLDNGQGLAQGVVPNNDRDRTELRESLRFGYEFLEGYEVWVRGSLNQRMYTTPVDASGFARNSNGWDLVGGFTIAVGNLTTAEVFAGYLQQNYADTGTPPLQGPQFGLAAYWNPLPELWVKPYVRRTINESAYVGISGYLNTAMGFETNYKVLPNVRLDGRFEYSIADYRAFSGNTTTTPQYDQYIGFTVGAMYLPVEQFFVGPQYTYVHRDSNLPGFSYGQNIIMLRLGARL
jgi:hypothetical protein